MLLLLHQEVLEDLAGESWVFADHFVDVSVGLLRSRL
jgi:hypothetical protein